MRRGKASVRKIKPDAVYGSVLVAKLINRSMYDGKKSTAEKQVHMAFELIKEKTKDDPVIVFEKALENIKPSVEVRPRRVGGAAYQVPMSVRGPRRESLGIRWLIKATQDRSNTEFHTFAEKLAAEIMAASNGEGAAVKKRHDIEKVAEANPAFAHFRW